MLKTTKREYTVNCIINTRRIKGVGTVYFITLSSHAYKWVVGPDFKKIGQVIPKDTPYYNDYDEAYNAFNYYNKGGDTMQDNKGEKKGPARPNKVDLTELIGLYKAGETYYTIKAAMGFASESTVTYHINKLIKAGELKKRPATKRGPRASAPGKDNTPKKPATKASNADEVVLNAKRVIINVGNIRIIIEENK